ncbi:MAG: transporter substrate-binding domain-containing protein [Pseudomonadota bacterium]
MGVLPKMLSLRALGLLVLTNLVVLPIWAQERSVQPLVAAVLDVPPFSFRDENGAFSGFIVDLAVMIGDEIGIPIEFLEVSDAQEFIQAQASGRTQIIAGVVVLPDLAPTNMFSDTIVTEQLLPAVLFDEGAPLTSAGIIDQRLAIAPPALGSNAPILDDNIAVEFDTPHSALMSLLLGSVDGVLLPTAVVQQIARKAGIDHRINFVGPPLDEVTRHVALHESRQDLIGPINAALANIESDGRLESLRQRYGLVVPRPPPDTLRIGITHLPPLIIIPEEAEPTGFNVDVTRALADRAGINIEFVPLSLADWVQGPSANELDAVAGLVVTEERLDRMDFSYPIMERNVALVLYADSEPDTVNMNGLVGRRVGVIEGSIFDIILSRYDEITPVRYATYDDLFIAQSMRDIDAAIGAPHSAEETIERLDVEDSLRIHILDDLKIETSIALRPGLGALRERLNAVTVGYLVTEEYKAIRLSYFGEQVFWTQGRVDLLIRVTVALLILLLAALFRQRQSQRRRELNRQVEHNFTLQQLVNDLEISNREQAEFTYAISHDLKAPTNTMGLLIDELEEDLKASAEDEDLINDMRATNRRMSVLITDVLDYSQIVDGEFSTETLDLNEIVDEIIADLAAQIKQSNATVRRSDLPTIDGNASQIRILFQNLISNGIKFHQPGQAPLVEIVSRGSSLMVTDNGIGIPEEKQDLIFGLFKRLHLTTEYEGTGLGLTICRRIMANHFGAIQCRSRLGDGTTFELHFDGIPKP